MKINLKDAALLLGGATAVVSAGGVSNSAVHASVRASQSSNSSTNDSRIKNAKVISQSSKHVAIVDQQGKKIATGTLVQRNYSNGYMLFDLSKDIPEGYHIIGHSQLRSFPDQVVVAPNKNKATTPDSTIATSSSSATLTNYVSSATIEPETVSVDQNSDAQPDQDQDNDADQLLQQDSEDDDQVDSNYDGSSADIGSDSNDNFDYRDNGSASSYSAPVSRHQHAKKVVIGGVHRQRSGVKRTTSAKPKPVTHHKQEKGRIVLKSTKRQSIVSHHRHATANRGMNSSEKVAKNWIANHESGGNYNARNGQYIGKYQLSSSYLHGDYSKANQEATANRYVKGRYGSWKNAKSFWEQHHWY